jgi:propanol-preferring alcohol dehydrogenase
VIEGICRRAGCRNPGHQVVGVVERGPGASRFGDGERIAWLRHLRRLPVLSGRPRESLQGVAVHRVSRRRRCPVRGGAQASRIPSPAFGDAEATALLCAGIIGYRALQRSEVPAGGTLGLWGFGSSAHVTMQVALARGCRVYVATRGARHRALAQAMGAAWVGGAGEPLPGPVDAGILFAPAGELVPVALRAIDAGGTLAVAGIHLSDVPRLDYGGSCSERSLRSVTANTRADGEGLLREAAAIPIRPRVRSCPLEDANRVLALLDADGIEGTGVLVP